MCILCIIQYKYSTRIYVSTNRCAILFSIRSKINNSGSLNEMLNAHSMFVFVLMYLMINEWMTRWQISAITTRNDDEAMWRLFSQCLDLHRFPSLYELITSLKSSDNCRLFSFRSYEFVGRLFGVELITFLIQSTILPAYYIAKTYQIKTKIVRQTRFIWM